MRHASASQNECQTEKITPEAQAKKRTISSPRRWPPASAELETSMLSILPRDEILLQILGDVFDVAVDHVAELVRYLLLADDAVIVQSARDLLAFDELVGFDQHRFVLVIRYSKMPLSLASR